MSHKSPAYKPVASKHSLPHSSIKLDDSNPLVSDSNPIQNYKSRASSSKKDSSDKRSKPKVTAINGGRGVSDKILYVGNLNITVTAQQLSSIFQRYYPKKISKILNDKNNSGTGYVFVEFEDATLASQAMQGLNRFIVNGNPLKINWAFHSSNANSVQSSDPVYNIFVGDLSPDINDQTLFNHFHQFNSIREAHVMWDMKTLRSRGYGFVTFLSQREAETAVQKMNGTILNGRAIRCNTASHKHASKKSHWKSSPIRNYGLDLSKEPSDPILAFQQVLSQSANWITTIYLGNLPHFVQQADIRPALEGFGLIVDFKLYPHKGCAFVTFSSHEIAALAILQLSGLILGGRPIKCAWGNRR